VEQVEARVVRVRAVVDQAVAVVGVPLGAVVD
jgi:hypothetical protein